ncbi:MAG: serine/threonine protein kinase [Phycisphaeraceae bacterium]|nr:serine/threonine protein kinase [Phycisphaeraceae bacterium]
MPVRTSQDTAAAVAARYSADPDPGFAVVCAATGAIEDHDVADSIEADARERLARGLPLTIERYLNGVPGIEGMRIALDAAIEFALRAAIAAGMPEADAARMLARQHPRLSAAIETAVALSDGLASTTTLGRSAGRSVPLQVPCEYGPRLPDGRRRFDVRERLGIGAQGEVYLAADHLLSEPDKPAWVAIKRLRPVAAADAASFAAAESLKARRIDHPNVVRVHDRGTDERSIEYIVYEHVDAGDLARWCARRSQRVPPREAARLVAAIARGVHAAHVAGVVHCDLKPSNILMTSSGEPKVADFGVAAAVRSNSGRIPDATPVGNLAYIAPEQYRAEEGAQAIPADIYALGGLLYFLLTGKAPNGETPAQVAARHARPDSPAPSARAAHPDIDDDLDAICRRALAPRPADRQPSAHALAEDLDAFLGHRPLEWRRPTPWRRFRLIVRRQPVVVAASVLLLLALIGASVGITRVFIVAERRVLEERLESLKTVHQEQQQSVERARRSMESLLHVLKFRQQGGVGLDWLPPLTIAESLIGPAMFDTMNSQSTVDLWTARVGVVKERVSQLEALGRAGDYETLLWRDALAFWALRIGDHEAARKYLDINDAHYESMLAPGDRWRDMRRGMRLTAAVLRAADRPVGTPLSDEARSVVEAAVRDLLALAEQIEDDSHNRALRLLFLMAAKRAFEPDMLDVPAQVAELQRRLVRREGVPAASSTLPAAEPAAPPPTR